ncbi:hypothetical protein MTO96_035451 [Rhipicephalus appendiculatus]
MPTPGHRYTLVGFSGELDWRELNFAEPIPPSIICNACGLVTRVTAFLPCLHVFCKRCYEQGHNDDVHCCPLDAQRALEAEVQWREFPARNVLKREVKCWNEHRGCDVVLSASELNKHFSKECDHHSTSCPRCFSVVLCSFYDYEFEKTYISGYHLSPSVYFKKVEQNLLLCPSLKLHKGVVDSVLQWPFSENVRLTVKHPSQSKEYQFLGYTRSRPLGRVLPRWEALLSCLVVVSRRKATVFWQNCRTCPSRKRREVLEGWNALPARHIPVWEDLPWVPTVDAGSSVSEVIAVGIGLRVDLGTRMQARARELEDEVSRFCADSANRITVSARNYIMTRVFELVSLCSDMREDAATERGAALALQGQLVDARREIAGLQRQVLVAERPPVGDVLGGLAAVLAVGPAAPVFSGGPGAEVAIGAASMGPAVLGGPTYAAMVRAGWCPWCWAGWPCWTCRNGFWLDVRKLERANAEFVLLVARKPIRYGTRRGGCPADVSYTDRLAGAAFIGLGSSERIGAVAM